MFRMSSSEISVPMEISAACLTSCSISSGKISERSVLTAFVLYPVKFNETFQCLWYWKIYICILHRINSLKFQGSILQKVLQPDFFLPKLFNVEQMKFHYIPEEMNKIIKRIHSYTISCTNEKYFWINENTDVCCCPLVCYFILVYDYPFSWQS